MVMGPKRRKRKQNLGWVHEPFKIPAEIYAAYNAAKGTTFPASLSQMNAMTQARLAEVDRYRQNAGGLSAPEVQPTDPNLRQWEWQVPNSRRTYYPTFRVDYNPSNRWRVNAAYNQTKENRPYQYADHWPGDGRGAAQHSNNMSLAFGLETILSPNLLNQVKGGYLYTYADFGVGGSDGFYTNPTINYGYGGYTDNYEMPKWTEMREGIAIPSIARGEPTRSLLLREHGGWLTCFYPMPFFRSAEVRVATDGRALAAYLYVPPGPGPFPGLATSFPAETLAAFGLPILHGT